MRSQKCETGSNANYICTRSVLLGVIQQSHPNGRQATMMRVHASLHAILIMGLCTNNPQSAEPADIHIARYTRMHIVPVADES
jgi:hypothetical protein